MATLMIDGRQHEVSPEVLERIMALTDEKDFYRKVLSWIAWGHIQGPGLTLPLSKDLASEAIHKYR